MIRTLNLTLVCTVAWLASACCNCMGQTDDFEESGQSFKMGGTGGGDVGETCSTGSDCASGICIDVSEFDDGCTGKVCTVECGSASDCPGVANDPDCEGVGDIEVCLYGAWESRFCD